MMGWGGGEYLWYVVQMLAGRKFFESKKCTAMFTRGPGERVHNVLQSTRQYTNTSIKNKSDRFWSVFIENPAIICSGVTEADYVC
jgi:hypothetical protein